jgi:hypothetical protein
MASAPTSAMIQTPMSKDDPTQTAIEEIPLPPPEFWGELDNSTAAPAATAPAVSEAVYEQDAEELDFVGDDHHTVVTLKHPFRRAGVVVDTIIVRRLRIGEVDGVLRRVGATKVSLFDIYAQMTGVPAPVLRGLIDEDGDAVTDAAYRFLPRALKADAE